MGIFSRKKPTTQSTSKSISVNPQIRGNSLIGDKPAYVVYSRTYRNDYAPINAIPAQFNPVAGKYAFCGALPSDVSKVIGYNGAKVLNVGQSSIFKEKTPNYDDMVVLPFTIVDNNITSDVVGRRVPVFFDVFISAKSYIANKEIIDHFIKETDAFIKSSIQAGKSSYEILDEFPIKWENQLYPGDLEVCERGVTRTLTNNRTPTRDLKLDGNSMGR